MNFIFQLNSVVLGQLIATNAPSLIVAQQVAPAVFSVLNLFSGFLIRRVVIPPWFIWIYYINPMNYILEAFVSNELQDTDFPGCQRNDTICYPTGDAFLNFYGMSASHKWRDLGIVVAFAVALRFLTWVILTRKSFQSK